MDGEGIYLSDIPEMQIWSAFLADIRNKVIINYYFIEAPERFTRAFSTTTFHFFVAEQETSRNR